MLNLIKLAPPWLVPVAAIAVAVGAYAWGRHDGRQLERSASLDATVKAHREAVDAAAEQLRTDQAIERERAASMAKLTDTVVTLLSQPPRTVTKYVEVPSHGQATVRCPAGVSPEFVRHWNSARDAADRTG